MDGNTICNYDGTECMSGVVRSLSCELKSIVSSPINIILHEQNISCENIRAPNISLRKIIAWKISRTGCLTNNQLILVDGLRRSHRQALDPLSAVKPAKRGSVLLMRRLGEVGAPLPLAASAEQAVENFFREPPPRHVDALQDLFPMLKNMSKNSPFVGWSVDWGLRSEPVVRLCGMWVIYVGVYLSSCVQLACQLVSIWSPFHLGCNRILYQFLLRLNTMIRCARIREKKYIPWNGYIGK